MYIKISYITTFTIKCQQKEFVHIAAWVSLEVWAVCSVCIHLHMHCKYICKRISYTMFWMKWLYSINNIQKFQVGFSTTVTNRTSGLANRCYHHHHLSYSSSSFSDITLIFTVYHAVIMSIHSHIAWESRFNLNKVKRCARVKCRISLNDVDSDAWV